MSVQPQQPQSAFRKRLDKTSDAVSKLPGEIYGKQSGEKIYHEKDVKYNTADQILQDLSTLKKGKVFELMQIWASEKEKRLFGVYKYAEKIFGGIEQFITAYIKGNNAFDKSNTRIDVRQIQTHKFKKKQLFRIILGLTYMFVVHANIDRSLVTNFITESDAIFKKGKVKPGLDKQKPELSKRQVREEIIKKAIGLVNIKIKSRNTAATASFKKPALPIGIPLDASEEIVIQDLFVELKRVFINKVKSAANYLNREASLNQNLAQYKSDVKTAESGTIPSSHRSSLNYRYDDDESNGQERFAYINPNFNPSYTQKPYSIRHPNLFPHQSQLNSSRNNTSNGIYAKLPMNRRPMNERYTYRQYMDRDNGMPMYGDSVPGRSDYEGGGAEKQAQRSMRNLNKRSKKHKNHKKTNSKITRKHKKSTSKSKKLI